MGFVGRSWYAQWNNIIFRFEWRRDRDYFIAHQNNAKVISAKDAYDNWKHQIKIPASCACGYNKKRKEKIKNWYGNK